MRNNQDINRYVLSDCIAVSFSCRIRKCRTKAQRQDVQKVPSAKADGNMLTAIFYHKRLRKQSIYFTTIP
jgi:hypothetical protein